MKYVIAVSGGVDSVVLLDMMTKVPEHELIVAHFDHGIRDNSREDAQFVSELANNYGLEYIMKREDLGAEASEALARERRYSFLRNVARSHNAQIVTAHHLDDLVETVAINLQRGTGWRGLAVFNSDVVRPLVDTPKQQLIQYAKEHALQWREDSTNATDAYLRNRIRTKTATISHDAKRQLRALHSQQKHLKSEIEKEVLQLVGEGPSYSRYLLSYIPQSSALECLRVITEGKLTRPQLMRCLMAVKAAQAGSVYEAGSGVKLRFSTRHFSL